MGTFTIHGGPSRIRLCRTVHDSLECSPNRRRLGAFGKILATDDPRVQKCLDRHIRHFEHDFWQQECEHLVLRGNLAKSSQKDEIRLLPLDTLTNAASPKRAPIMTNCWASA